MADITTSRIVYNNEGPPIQANGFIRIDSSGGTDNYYLELYEAGAQRFRIYENSNNVYFDGGPGNTIFRPRQGGGSNNFIISGSDVMIGTTTSQGKLTAVGAIQTVVADLAANDSVGLSVMGMPTNNFNAITLGSANSTNNSAVWRFKYNGAGSTNNYFGLGFYGNDDILNVKANGRVGINQITPESELHIEGNGGDGLAMLRMIATGNGTFNWMSSSVYSNLGIGNTCLHLFGKEQASKNQGYIGFTFAGDHSDNNRVTIGMYAQDYLFNVLANGNVGIGTTSPGQLLTIGDSSGSSFIDINKSTSGENGIIFNNAGNRKCAIIQNSSEHLEFHTLNNNVRMIIQEGGLVGIGITNPSYNLHVVSTIGTRVLKLGHGVGHARISTDDASKPLDLQINSVNALRVATSKDIGIGTDNPQSRVHVYNANTFSAIRLQHDNGSGSTASIVLQTDSSGIANDGFGIYDVTNAAYNLTLQRFSTGSATSTRMTIGPYVSGTKNIEAWLVGVDENHSIKFRVGSNNKTYYYSYGGAGTDKGHQFYTGGTVAQQSLRLGISDDRIIALTNVGIGNTSPSQKLHVTGSILASSDVVAFSDIKLKENIKTLDGSRVYDMRGVSFTRKDTGKDSSGVIAQEIQKIAPELVTDNDGTLSVAYGNLTGYLIEAVKELKTEIEKLKKCNCNCKK